MSSVTPQPQETRSHLSATSSLPTPSNAPAIVSRFTARKHCNSDAVVASVREYFTVNWPWTGAEEQEKFVKQDLELAGPFFYPDALDDRIELATLLFSLCFLIDDILDQWNYEQVCLSNAVRVTVEVLITITGEGIFQTVSRPSIWHVDYNCREQGRSNSRRNMHPNSRYR
jgi:hypothetical protein